MFPLVGLLLLALWGAGGTPATTLGVRQMPAAAGAMDHLSAGALHGRTVAVLIVQDAASRVEVRLVELPGLLYRISTPADSGLAPAVSGGPGRVRVRLRPTGAAGPDAVRILLNQAVRWDIRLPAGAGEQHLDLAAGRLRRLQLGSGTGLVSLRLPAPRGTVPIAVAGGVGEVTLAAPAGTPVRLRLRGGADVVAVPWSGRTSAGPHALMAPAAWRTAGNRYAVDVATAVGAITIRS